MPDTPTPEPAPKPAEQRAPGTPPPASAETSKPGKTKKPKRPEPTTFKGKLWHHWVKPIGTVVLIVTVVRSTFIDWNDVPTGSMNPAIVEGDRILVNKAAYGIKPPLAHGIPIPFSGYTLPIYGPFTDKYLIPLSGPDRNDIVTFWKPDTDADGHPIRDGGIRMVKRVVAIPGDTLKLENGLLSIMPEGDDTWHKATLENITPPDRKPVQVEEVNAQGFRQLQFRVVEEYQETILGETRHIHWLPERHPRWRRGQPRLLSFGPVTLGPDEYWMMGDNRDNSGDSRVFGPVKRHAITGRALRVAWSLDGWSPKWSRTFMDLDD
ncbi:MAG: signal peptidase I [Planctomycetota bacterium]